MTLTTQLTPPPPEPHRRLFSREEFERLARIGLFGPQERVELVEGEIIEKMTQNSPHVVGVRATEEALREVFGSGFDVRVQMPLALGAMSQPDPDIAVVVGSFRDYESVHPSTALLVVEISDTTLGYDRNAKAAMYGRANIPEYWILNLNERVLEVRREPVEWAADSIGVSYSSVTRLNESESVSPLARPMHQVVVSSLLPRSL
jgi:Uma2 family endonuclease